MACTGVFASWCPHCGDCTCPKHDSGEPIEREVERPTIWRPWSTIEVVHADACPLHGASSEHCPRHPSAGLPSITLTEAVEIELRIRGAGWAP